jgi:PhnB protein
MPRLEVFLRFPGTCEAAVRFYQSVFGGELAYLQRYKETRAHGVEISKEDEEKIAFVSFVVDGQALFSADDFNPQPGLAFSSGSNVILQVAAASRAEVDRIFSLLSPGGAFTQPPRDAFWGEYFAYFQDKFGIWWNIGHHTPPG